MRGDPGHPCGTRAEIPPWCFFCAPPLWRLANHARDFREIGGNTATRQQRAATGTATSRARNLRETAPAHPKSAAPQRPRYARVPSGAETCRFCIMLASRGAVYLSKENAGAVGHYHANCDCKVVPDWGDGIEGYDPEGLYERWSACERTVGGTEAAYAEWREMDEAARSKYKGDDDGERFGRFARARILREVEARDPRWLHEGKAPDIDYSDVPRDEFGHVKNKSDGFNSEEYDSDNIGKKGREWRDLFIHDALRESGMKVKPRPANAPDGYSNIDADIDGKLYEFKSPEEPKEKPKPGRELAFIESNLRGAKKQFGNQFDESTGGRLQYDGSVRVVLSLRYRDADLEAAINETVRRMRQHSIDEVIILSGSGRVIRLKR